MANPLAFLWRRKAKPAASPVLTVQPYPSSFFWLISATGYDKCLAFYCKQCGVHYRGVQRSSVIQHCGREDKVGAPFALPSFRLTLPNGGGAARLIDTDEFGGGWDGTVGYEPAWFSGVGFSSPR
jgi:hypothetical protein